MGGMGLTLVSRQCVQALLSYLPGEAGSSLAGERGVGPLGGLPRVGRSLSSGSSGSMNSASWLFWGENEDDSLRRSAS